MPTNRCSAKTAAGEPCKATPRGERALCLWHDPDLAEAAQEFSTTLKLQPSHPQAQEFLRKAQEMAH